MACSLETNHIIQINVPLLNFLWVTLSAGYRLSSTYVSCSRLPNGLLLRPTSEYIKSRLLFILSWLLFRILFVLVNTVQTLFSGLKPWRDFCKRDGIVPGRVTIDIAKQTHMLLLMLTYPDKLQNTQLQQYKYVRSVWLLMCTNPSSRVYNWPHK